METVTSLPQSRPLTHADLAALPDDGHRYELIDGSLVVSPAPGWRHQQVVLELAVLLRARCPADLLVFVAPLDVVLAGDTVLQPDVLVARRSDLAEHGLRGAPVLAVEVISPSTRRVDLLLKRSRYEAAGAPSYWVMDPVDVSLTAWDLVAGSYVEVAHVVGADQWTATSPFPVRVCPGELVD